MGKQNEIEGVLNSKYTNKQNIKTKTKQKNKMGKLH